MIASPISTEFPVGFTATFFALMYITRYLIAQIRNQFSLKAIICHLKIDKPNHNFGEFFTITMYQVASNCVAEYR